MAREKGGLISCLRKTMHHVSPSNVGLLKLSIEEGDEDAVECVVYRFALIRDELETAMNQLLRIKEVAEKKGLAEVMSIIEEEVEFGHEW